MEHQTVIPYMQQIKAIKSAILQSRYHAAARANAEMLSLYYGIGEYISHNSRKGFWGTNAIETIAAQLKQKLPVLRGFSATNIKRMRRFYEEWSSVINSSNISDLNRPPMVVEIDGQNCSLPVVDLQTVENQNNTIQPLPVVEINIKRLLSENQQSISNDFNWKYFIKVGFVIKGKMKGCICLYLSCMNGGNLSRFFIIRLDFICSAPKQH